MKNCTLNAKSHCVPAGTAGTARSWNLIVAAIIISMVGAFSVPTSAQAYLYHYQKLLDNELDVRNYTIEKIVDGGYLVAAGFSTVTGWHYPHGLTLYKLDADLNTVWNTAYAPVYTRFSTFKVEDLIECISGEIVVCGSLRSNESRALQAFVAKFESDGNMLWFRTYTPSVSFTSIVERPDQAGFMLCGDALYQSNINGFVCWIDDQGNPVWAFNLPAQISGTRTRYEEIIKTDDGCIAVGNINFIPNWPDPVSSEVLLSRFDWDGVVQYHTVYRGVPDSSFHHTLVAKSLTITDSVAFITGAVMVDSLLKDSIIVDSVIGTIRMVHDVLVMAADLSTGYPYWQKRYNTSEPWFYDQYVDDEWGEKILVRQDSLIVCGHSISYHNIYQPSRDGFLLRTGLTGVPLPHTHFGDTLQDYLYDMVQNSDTIVMAGFSNTLHASRYDIYLVEWFPVITSNCLFETHSTPYYPFLTNTDTVFWYAIDCTDEMIDIHEEYIDVIEPVLCDKIKVQIIPRLKSPLQSSLRLYPNPASDAVFVIGDDDNMLHIYMYTVYGNLVAEHRLLSGESYPIGHLPSGTYIVRVVSETADQQSFKLIIQ